MEVRSVGAACAGYGALLRLDALDFRGRGCLVPRAARVQKSEDHSDVHGEFRGALGAALERVLVLDSYVMLLFGLSC